MTRYKELRRLERSIENSDRSELEWAAGWCRSRLPFAKLKQQQKHWRALLQKVEAKIAEIQDRAPPSNKSINSTTAANRGTD